MRGVKIGDTATENACMECWTMPGHNCIVCVETPLARIMMCPFIGFQMTQGGSEIGLTSSSFLLHPIGAFTPLQSSHHLSAATACDSQGLLRSAPGISEGLSVTETGHEELAVASPGLVCPLGILVVDSYSFSVAVSPIFTPRTPFLPANALVFHYFLFK